MSHRIDEPSYSTKKKTILNYTFQIWKGEKRIKKKKLKNICFSSVFHGA